MKTSGNKKKLLLAALLTTGITMGLAHTGIAANTTVTQPAPAPQAGTWNCPWLGNDPAMIEKHNKFLQETTTLRKQMAVKQAEKRSMMRSSQVDSAKVSQLTGEIFDLREQLRAKAQENGLPMGMMGGGMGRGKGMGAGGGAWWGPCGAWWGPCDGTGPGPVGPGPGRGGRMGR